MASSKPTVCPAHGSSLDREGKGTSHPRMPQTTSSAPGSAMFGFGEARKKIHEELLNVRKAMEEMEIIEKEFLEEEARFEQEMQALRSAGLTDKEIREMMDWTPANFPPRPPSAKPLDANVGVYWIFLRWGGDLPWVRQSVMVDLGRVNLGSEQGVERPAKTHEEKPAQQTEEELVNRTPIPGGPMYSSVNHSRGIHQNGKYGHVTPSTTPANNAHQNSFMHQATSWNEQAQVYPGATGRHGSIPPRFQMPSQIYQATPGKRFNSSVDSLPPRFRQPPAYNQSVPLHYQNVVQTRPNDTVPIGHPGPWPLVPNQPQSSTPNHSFRPVAMPPPPRPYFYEVDLVFDFEGVALSSNCNRDVFVKTYWKMNGFSPSQAAWAAWASVVDKVKRSQQHEYQKAVESAREQYGAGSRLPKWCPNSMEDHPGSEPGYSSSLSDASTKVASSRTSETGDERSAVVSVVGPSGGRGVKVLRVQKRWKDITDKTWAFGEPPRQDDPEHYMTHVVEKMGWQVHDPRPE